VSDPNGVGGSGRSVSASAAANTAAGAAPSNGRHRRAPATSAHQLSAAACMWSRLVNSPPPP
jgi:hypothetical protein